MPMEIDEKKAIETVIKLKALYGIHARKRKEALILKLFEACNWDRRKVKRRLLPVKLIQKVVQVEGRPIKESEINEKVLKRILTKAVDQPATSVYAEIRREILFGTAMLENVQRYGLSKTIDKNRRKAVLQYTKNHEEIDSLTKLAEEIGYSKRGLIDRNAVHTEILEELRRIITLRTRKKMQRVNSKATPEQWFEAIVANYGNVLEAGRQLGHNTTSSSNEKSYLKTRGIDVDKAIRVGELKHKNDLMFVLKMTGFNKKRTAEIFGIVPRTLYNWITKFGITKKTIEVYKTPFAVIPVGKVKDYYPEEIPIKDGKFFVRNYNDFVNAKITNAKKRILESHPDRGGSTTRFNKAIKNLKQIRALDARIRQIFGLPPKTEKGEIRIPKKGRSPGRWEILKFKPKVRMGKPRK